MTARTVTFTAPICGGGAREVTGYRTTTPGLVVYQDENCGYRPGVRVFHVAHVRSGLQFPFCWRSPEAALAFADSARRFGDWHVTGTPLARRIALPFVRRGLIADALAVGGHDHGGYGDRIGDVHAVDNGRVA
ncbi:hypothetical protein [Actinomadura atramentaria]|uniref:hypothetical protein n=1 Tax=Actinomadura atramentaria TaxID=1990 RepID=UPI0003795C04